MTNSESLLDDPQETCLEESPALRQGDTHSEKEGYDRKSLSGENGARQPGSSAKMTSAENLFPDLHQKMSKKIAQLTKVIFHLNSKNEEHSDDLTALSDAYETEIDGILKDAYTKVRHPPSPPDPSSASQICALNSQPSQPQTLLPWRQPGGKLMVSLASSHKNATRVGD